MKKTITLMLIALSLAAGAARAATQTIKADINGMVCAFCAQGIEKKMRAQAQTGDVHVSLKHKVLLVELKEGQTLAHDKVKQLVKDAGYDVTNIQTVGESVKQLKAKLGKE